MEPPIKPSESDCCNSGCNPCILDIYEEQLKKFNTSLNIAQSPKNNCLSLTSYSVFKLVNITRHSKNCNLYTFEYLRPQNDLTNNNPLLVIMYEPGQYLLLKGRIYGDVFQKAYTPIYIDDQASNQFTILVKLYPNGRMSRLFQNMSVGNESLWRGPYGDFKINYNNKNMLFISQGTGVAPFYSILCDILNNEECFTFLTLFSCCNIENVLLRDELYKLGEYWNFKYVLFISGGTEEVFKTKYNEKVYFSRLQIEHVKEYLIGAKNDVKLLICGAENFNEEIKKMVMRCGISNDDITLF